MTLDQFLAKNENVARWDEDILKIAGPKESWWHHTNKRFCTKNRIFKKIFNHGLLSEPIDYFEFGVSSGSSTLVMSHLLEHVDSRIYGFDTFTGLPEPLYHHGVLVQPKSAFSQEGYTPIDRGIFHDTRCIFFKGLVKDTLPPLLGCYQNRSKFINLDMDLYEGTWFVLDRMAPLLLPGDVVKFDEFTGEEHEYRAYQNYVAAHGDNLHLVGQSFNQFVFVKS